MINKDEFNTCINENEYKSIFKTLPETVITHLGEVNMKKEPIEDDKYSDDKKIVLENLRYGSENSKKLIENVDVNDRKLFEISDYQVSCREELVDFQVKSEEDEMSDTQPMNCNWIDVQQINEEGELRSHSIEEIGNYKNVCNSKMKHQCTKCEYQTKFRSHMNLHLLKHADVRSYVCDTCNKRFKLSCHLKSHALTHLVEARFYCMHCNYKTTNKAYLTEHLKNKHSTVKKYRCSMCDYQSNHRSKLRTHLVTHNNVKPFLCTVCNKQFKLNHQLKRHRFIHSVEKKFHCARCEYKSNQKRDFDMHLKNKHGKVNDKDFKCLMCPYQTNLRHRYIKHTEKHLPDGDNKITNDDKTVV